MKILAKIVSSLFIVVLLAGPSLPRAYAEEASTTPTTLDDASGTSSSTPQIKTLSTSSSTPDITGSTTDETTNQDDTDDTSSSTTSTSGTARIAIFDNGIVVTTTTVSLPSSNAPKVSILADDGSTYTVPADSALGMVATLDQSADEFSLSDIANSPGLGLYVKCIMVPAIASDSVCDAWQYAVNGLSPFDAMGDHLISNGDTIDLYAGNLRQTLLSNSTVAINTPFSATVTQFDPTTGTYLPAPGFTIGVTQYDPVNPFTPIEIATSTSDTNGNATFSVANAGEYGVGISEDYYYPLTSLTVAGSTTSTTDGTSGNDGGSGGSSNTNTSRVFDASAAFAYLEKQQSSNGSFNADVYTDWSAFALALPDAPSGARSSLTNYLKSASPSLSSATDYERHVMALMALGINPYSGATQNYIAPLVALFDGGKIGTKITDDIFAILPLLHAGYHATDPIIQKTTLYILLQQHPDGSWDGGVDTTAAAIQELSSVSSLSGVSGAIAKARTYLKGQQKSDGSIGNDDSTSWSLQAIAALGDSPSNWSVGTSTPLAYLASKQQPDGSVNSGNENVSAALWSTIYALPAAEGKTWNALLGSFSIPSADTSDGSGNGNSATSTSATATTTETTATVTEASSTEPLISPLQVNIPAIAAARSPLIGAAKALTTKQTDSINPTQTSTTSPLTANTYANGEANTLTASAEGTPMAAAIAYAIEHFFGMVFGGLALFFAHLFWAHG